MVANEKLISQASVGDLFESIMVHIWDGQDPDSDKLGRFYDEFHDASQLARLLGGTVEGQEDTDNGLFLTVRFRDGSRRLVKADGSAVE